MIRRAAAEDAPACARIVSDWLGGLDWMPDPPGRGELQDILRAGLPRREAWIAEADGATLGYISLEPATDHIHALYVATPGTGTGKRLLDHVKRGRDRLTLNSHAPNTAAHRFYAREGFHATRRDIPGDDGVPEIAMEWRP